MKKPSRKHLYNAMKFYESFQKDVSEELGKALRDARLWGSGFLEINSEGCVRHVSIKELQKELDLMGKSDK